MLRVRMSLLVDQSREVMYCLKNAIKANLLLEFLQRAKSLPKSCFTLKVVILRRIEKIRWYTKWHMGTTMQASKDLEVMTGGILIKTLKNLAKLKRSYWMVQHRQLIRRDLRGIFPRLLLFRKRWKIRKLSLMSILGRARI